MINFSQILIFINICSAAFDSVKDTINREAGTKLVYVIQVGYTMT